MTGSRWLLLTALLSLTLPRTPKLQARHQSIPQPPSAVVVNRELAIHDHQQKKDTSSIYRGSAVLN